MANKTEEKVAQMEETEENKEETKEMEQENKEATGNVVQLPTQPKKGGFFREMSIGAKIGFSLVIGGLVLGGGYLVKCLVGGKGNEAAADAPIEAEGSVSESTEG